MSGVGLDSATPKYSQTLLITVNGSNLDQGLRVTSSACRGIELSAVAPNISNSSTAYFTCKVSALGASQVDVASTGGGSVLASASLTVAVPQVTLNLASGGTGLGSVVLTLEPASVPITVDNFLEHVNTGFYDGTIMHWVASDIVQGGGYLPLNGGTTPAAKPSTLGYIAREVGGGLRNTTWSVAMARLGPADSASSQFFINLQDNSAAFDPSSTNAGNVVFAAVSSGAQVVSAVAGVNCAAIVGFSPCAPNPDVVIASATQTR